eukprot:8249801-Pyramimonas_sp.AAC.1
MEHDFTYAAMPMMRQFYLEFLKQHSLLEVERCVHTSLTPYGLHACIFTLQVTALRGDSKGGWQYTGLSLIHI